jgi:PAS domain S-box-containing protein
MFVRGVSCMLVPLSFLAVAHMGSVHASLPIILVTVAATAGYAAAFWLANAREGTWHAAGLLVCVMQAQYFVGALTLTVPSEMGSTIMFSGMIPLIAAATLELPGVVLASGLASLGVCSLFVVKVWLGGDFALESRALGAPLFFVLFASVVGVFSSITERRSMREQLLRERSALEARAAAEAAEQRLRLITDQVSDLVGILDERGAYLFASASYESILGLSPSMLVGRRPPDIIHPEDRASVEHTFREALKGHSREVVARLRGQNGQYRTFHLKMLGVRTDGLRQVAVASRDITELQALTAELEAARRMDALGRLAGGVAHDFNNLLAVIGSCASMVRSGLSSHNEASRDLSIIEDAVQKAAVLTGQLLSFARRQVLPGGQAASSRTIHELEPLLQRAMGGHVRLQLDLEGSRWDAQLSAGALEQIVMNLAVNARDAMSGVGNLTVRALDRALSDSEVPDLQAGDYVVIEVGDTGPGIDPAIRSRIFEPFFTTKQPGKGTGLGLSTSFGVARQVGGTLTVDSIPGEGAMFRVYLPRAKGGEQAKEPPREAEAARASSGLSVLVIDDEARIRELIARLLEMAGHRAVTAACAAEALELAQRQAFDDILVDVVLGHEDGLDLLARLRELQPRAKCIVMSGYSPSPQRLSALRETGVEFLAKPFAVGALLRAVAPPSVLAPQPEDSLE